MEELIATMVPKAPHRLTPEFKKAALTAANNACANVTFQEDGTIKISKPVLVIETEHGICIFGATGLNVFMQIILMLDEMYN